MDGQNFTQVYATTYSNVSISVRCIIPTSFSSYPFEKKLLKFLHHPFANPFFIYMNTLHIQYNTTLKSNEIEEKRFFFTYIYAYICLFPAVVQSRLLEITQKDEKNECKEVDKEGVCGGNDKITQKYIFKKVSPEGTKTSFSRLLSFHTKSSDEYFYNVLFLSVLYSSRNFFPL